MYLFDEIFMDLVNKTFSASWLILAVIIFRLIFKKCPKWINCFLWLLVGVKLLCPISFESELSLNMSKEVLTNENFYYSSAPVIESYVDIIDSTVNPIISDALSTESVSSVNASQIFGFLMGVLWLVGLCVMLLYALISYIKLKNNVKTALPLRDNILICDEVSSPFILGFIKPKIYLPSNLSETTAQYVISHENAHIKRKDHWWKPLGFAVLSLYWFNPLLWVSYILLCRDIELACDEKVLKEKGTGEKKNYSEAIFSCSAKQKYISACPVAFGEVGVKQRIKAVLSYKKPTLWIIIIALTVSAVIGIFFMTDPKDKTTSDVEVTASDLDTAISKAIFEINGKYQQLGECETQGHILFGTKEKGNEVTAYLLEKYSTFGFENGFFVSKSGHTVPAVMTFEKTEVGYSFLDAEYAEDGSNYAKSIKRMFPAKYENRALYISEEDTESMWAQCVAQAESYLKEIGRQAEICSYGDIEHILLTDVGVSVEVSNKLLSMKVNFNTSEIGCFEEIEDGIRYVYRTSYLQDKNIILYTKEVYSTKEIIEKIEVDSLTGNVMSSTTNEILTEKYFDAKVLEVKDNMILVEPFESYIERNSSDKILVSTDVSSSVPVPDFYEGLYVRIFYDGTIEETYPAKINKVSAIYLYADVNYIGNYASKPEKVEATTIGYYIES